MIAGVADTHTALWYLYDDARLSVVAGDFIDQAAVAATGIYFGMPVISRDGRIRAANLKTVW